MLSSIGLFRFDRSVQMYRRAGLAREARRGQSNVTRTSNLGPEPSPVLRIHLACRITNEEKIAWLEYDLSKIVVNDRKLLFRRPESFPERLFRMKAE